MKKKGYIFSSAVDWILVVIALIIVIYVTYNILNSHKEAEIKCEKLGGECAEREEECVNEGLIAIKGMGCLKYCCLQESYLIREEMN